MSLFLKRFDAFNSLAGLFGRGGATSARYTGTLNGFELTVDEQMKGRPGVDAIPTARFVTPVQAHELWRNGWSFPITRAVLHMV